MEQTLKVTNVLSDPTRYNIYQYIIQEHREVNVIEIAKQFEIHPNVARLHLSKLEDIKMVVSYSKKTGKGGRPSRIYRLSNEVIELNFPHRDYKLLSTIALESFVELGEPGKIALYNTGKKYGMKVMEHYQAIPVSQDLTIEQKIHILEDAGTMLGMYPKFEYNPENKSIKFKINNCPFKEIATNNHTMVCNMHNAFLKGMFEVLFTNVDLIEEENMFQGCESCIYVAKLSVV
ncbi:transcriptional regulator [Virgibacillus profundi]|uniref:Transcriptional regulator n=1 Tax=Virgibacillus profundi TaxID=2024555 RepID=A0A2A2IBX8_9BACI|nr:helix-turn-helix domain-containing protein [Virgibacillus profundi]PAV29072.1 transcriptional regulator [Virgibacillus profundi]PXY53241.1 transcriptional regulator [Virgibacillus profundi]